MLTDINTPRPKATWATTASHELYHCNQPKLHFSWNSFKLKEYFTEVPAFTWDLAPL